MGRLEGKSAFVTGAGGSIGGAIAERFAMEGARVMCVDIDEDAASQSAERIRLAGGMAMAHRCDVSSSDDVRKAVDRAATELSGLHIVVNTAASDDPSANVVDLEEADWNTALAVNLTGTFLVCKCAIPKLIAAGGGSIVNVASQLGSVVVPDRPAYVTTKAAVIQLSRSMALDHAGDNIRVNSLSPGATETNRLVVRFGNMERAREVLVPMHPIGRLGQPEDIANGALFLASDEASFMTGADLIIDGGYTAV